MRYLLLLSLISLAACQPQQAILQPTAEQAIENVTCPQSQSYLFDTLYRSLTELKEVPSQSQLEEIFQAALESKSNVKIDHKEFLALVANFYEIVLEIPSENPQDLLEKVTALEIGDRSTDLAELGQNKLKNFEAQWKQFQSAQDVACSEAPAVQPPTETEPEPAAVSLHAIAKGGRKILATAYQSCEANRLPPMTKQTAAVVGIIRNGTHSDGVGAKREISDLPALLRTDYYLKNYVISSSCRDIRNQPPIYDYGGKPKATADANSSLDFFSNAGSGTSVLGVDCSAYVFAAIATSGLKLHPDKKMKAILVNGISSRMYMNPADNGMTCFDKVKMGITSNLKAGDIAAISGHVVLIDSIGDDPLGLSKAKTASQCSSLSSQNFDFVVAQSSPSKNGIGINRFRAADYLAQEPTLRAGFEQYARQACAAKLQGQDVLMSANNFQIIRHKMTAGCMDRAIALVGESCAQSCGSL